MKTLAMTAGGSTLVGDDLIGAYVGETRSDGVRQGQGCYTYPNAFFEYDGEYVSGKKHGRGTLRLSACGSYTGEFCNDEIHGAGTRTYGNGDVYHGAFALGEPHGHGTMDSQARGWTYTGSMVHGAQHGAGVKRWHDGRVYEGAFSEGLIQGEGTMTERDGSTYLGSWVAGCKCGFGEQTLCSGERYKGDFQVGQYHGTGTLWRDGILYCRHQFRAGAPVPQATALHAEYAKPASKKGGSVPEVPLGAQSGPALQIRVTVHAAQRVEDGAPTPPGGTEALGEVCALEARRPITVQLFRGWPDEHGAVGEAVGEPCLLVPKCSLEAPDLEAVFALHTPEENREVVATAPDSQAESSEDAATLRLEVQPSQKQLAGVSSLPGDSEAVSEWTILARNGSVDLGTFQIGIAGPDGKVTLPAGPCTLVLSSPDVASAHVPLTLVAQKAGGTGKK